MSAILGYGRPDSPVWAIAGGDAAFDTDPSYLNNGRVADKTAIQWRSGAQTTSTTVQLQMTWSVAQPVRKIPILGLKNLPAGTKIEVSGKRAGDTGFPYALGGNSTGQRTFTMPDGSVGLWVILPATNTPLIGIQVTIYNDVNGAASIPASSFVYVGEIDALQGFEFDIRDGQLQASHDGLPSNLRAVNNQPHALPAQPYRTYTLDTIPLGRTKAFGTISSGSTTYEQLVATIIKGDVITLTPTWDNGTGTLDNWIVHQTSVLGVASGLRRPQTMGDNYFITKLGITESPPGV